MWMGCPNEWRVGRAATKPGMGAVFGRSWLRVLTLWATSTKVSQHKPIYATRDHMPAGDPQPRFCQKT